MSVKDTIDSLEDLERLKRVEKKLMGEVIALVIEKSLQHPQFSQKISALVGDNKRRTARNTKTPREYLRTELSALHDFDPVVLYESKNYLLHKIITSPTVKDAVDSFKKEQKPIKKPDSKKSLQIRMSEVGNTFALLKEYTKKDHLRELGKELASFTTRLNDAVENHTPVKPIKRNIQQKKSGPKHSLLGM